jgi:AraC-like DNA-binding protein
MSVIQIVGGVGTTSFSYFVKAFRAATEMTPSNYRKSGLFADKCGPLKSPEKHRDYTTALKQKILHNAIFSYVDM